MHGLLPRHGASADGDTAPDTAGYGDVESVNSRQRTESENQEFLSPYSTVVLSWKVRAHLGSRCMRGSQPHRALRVKPVVCPAS